ncbi:MAG TPA: MarR family transcriptional regulator, partial [Thermoanaerobaculia bacterium]|nr:MarR family transcriptional regulator [Thermoanaerobaculia bacterium]
IDRLEKKKLVSRKRCTSDRRQVFCLLAPAGARLLARMDAPVSRMDAFLSMLGDADVATLIRLLDAIRAGLSRSTPSRPRA